MKLTHHSTDMDIVDRLEYASMSTPEIHLLREAAQCIRELRKELEDDSIVLLSESTGEELCTIDGELAEFVRKAAFTEFFNKLLTEMIEEHESRRRSD
jgi:predicted nucleic acid-binding protein